jgi:hypothetical protein
MVVDGLICVKFNSGWVSSGRKWQFAD